MFALLFLLLCTAYLVALPWTPVLLAACLKILPIAALAVRAARRAAGRKRTFLVLALIFSLTGDVVLALSRDTLFVLGVAAFLVAHVLYIVTFRPDMRYSPRSARLAAIVVAWCAVVAAVLFPHLGTLRAPVIVYMLVIAAMGVSASFAAGTTLVLFAGAFAFIVSDSILAIDRFVAHVRHAPYLVMSTYYLGQFCIVAGVIGRHTARVAVEGR